MYETVVYDGQVKIDGNFTINSSDLNKSELDLPNALIFVGVADMSGLYKEFALTLNGQKLNMARGTGGPLLAASEKVMAGDESFDSGYDGYRSGSAATNSGLYAKIDLSKLPTNSTFSVNISLKGSQELTFVPVGQNTTVNLKSSWTHPSFVGNYLPDSSDDDTNNENGFAATWKISEFNSSKPATFTQSQEDRAELSALANQAFGVKFKQDVDFYQKSERAIKYALLFIILTFVTLFCFEF
jgi:inner membrane protein